MHADRLDPMKDRANLPGRHPSPAAIRREEQRADLAALGSVIVPAASSNGASIRTSGKRCPHAAAPPLKALRRFSGGAPLRDVRSLTRTRQRQHRHLHQHMSWEVSLATRGEWRAVVIARNRTAQGTVSRQHEQPHISPRAPPEPASPHKWDIRTDQLPVGVLPRGSRNTRRNPPFHRHDTSLCVAAEFGCI